MFGIEKYTLKNFVFVFFSFFFLVQILINSMSMVMFSLVSISQHARENTSLVVEV